MSWYSSPPATGCPSVVPQPLRPARMEISSPMKWGIRTTGKNRRAAGQSLPTSNTMKLSVGA
jgi:hypothetical protein